MEICPLVAGAALWVPPGDQLESTGGTPYPELQSGPPGPETPTEVVFDISVTTRSFTNGVGYPLSTWGHNIALFLLTGCIYSESGDIC